METSAARILVTGPTGYVGGRLLRLLLGRGLRVRAMARTPRNLEAPAREGLEVVQGDVFAPETLRAALEGVDVAFYLIHSMGAGEEFAERDAQAARHFAEAAAEAGIRKIVYLGGLGDERAALSRHLASRQEVGEVLASTGVPVLEFRASIIIGSGSLSFEIVRALTERLPVMVAPRWVHTPAQPIAIEDVLAYLSFAMDTPCVGHQIYEIGGSDVVSYGDLLREYARLRGLRRYLLPVPFLSPALSSWWLVLVTPANALVGRKLIDGVRVATRVTSTRALETFPVRPMSIRQAMERALVFEDRQFAETRWTDALSAARETSYGGQQFGSRIIDSQELFVGVRPESAFAPIRRIGGDSGWYYGTFLWRIRGLMDEIAGGVGLRRGRKSVDYLAVGETLDWWRVEELEPDRRLRLRAEMLVPGRAWLEFEVRPEAAGSTIRQTAIFDPKGILGLAYWYVLYPIHKLMFRGMLRQIAFRAQQWERAAAMKGLPAGS
ncbi:MAG: SDR family oxidoreductase [Bryobacterales bacterium]|jgi:uncharacterized protein YbjT (DUF2867 family)|nr:SDR family oxidoreductase [Bryobacterales bacterium]